MADTFRKERGASASAIISEAPEGLWRASLVVSDPGTGKQHTQGPEVFPSPQTARRWLLMQAASLGFTEADFSIQLEKAEDKVPSVELNTPR